ncbi:efflux RND transporter permease subunit [Niveibacterium terrae]|uniref:efflux RND transporter permease subunit n=1 Tax=Niveibacterium terrae TaxID=3373598 RepID=UPI003A94A6BC
MARFFIDRPIFAWVIAILICLGGLLSIFNLSLEQYPDIAPPQITIQASYPGASGSTVEESVTQIIEQGMTGIDNMQSMSATSSSDGKAKITLGFVAGTNPDVAQMQTQNKVQQITSRLPAAVQDQGVTVTKSGTDFLLIVALYSDDPKVTAADVGDFMTSNLKDVLSRINGVGEVVGMGASYAMRIWLDPGKLQKYALMPSDVTSALTAQNTQVSAGQLGGLPATSDQRLNVSITARSKLRTVEEFSNVIVKAASDGAIVHLSDVARIELGREAYVMQNRFKGKPSAGIGIRLATGANALDVAKTVKAKIAAMEPYFPKHIKSAITYDTTPFVKISIEEVVITLIEAILLVVAVMYLFMQNLRATLIPAIAVPVVLLGTMGVLAVFGYSINTLTMFGLVLAIGLLVDDAIVVVENVERIMSEEKVSAREATRESMREITGALVGIALVLSAVFIPMAFFSGSTGVIYRQFSITIVSSMLLSVFVAMSLSPALCATLMRASDVEHYLDAKPHGFIGRFFAGFNRCFKQGSDRYQSGVKHVLQRGKRFALIYLLIIAALFVTFQRLPTSYLPDEDQGALMAVVQLPSGATLERTNAVLGQLENYLSKSPDVAAYMTLVGMNGDQASANAFIRLKDWSERKGDAHSAMTLSHRMTRDLSTIRDARVFVMLPPVIRGLGSSSGFTVELEDNANMGHEELAKARDQFLQLARQSKVLTGVRMSGLADVAQFSIDIDEGKAAAMKLSSADINSTLSTALGGSYVNDFVNNKRVKRVYVQGDAPFRMGPDDIMQWHVRNSDGEMVPFSAFARTSWSYGSPRLERYSGIASYEIVGSPAPGYSSGDAMNAVEEIVSKLPRGVGFEWAGQSFQEKMAGSQAPMLYAISIVFVFLCLAALYESWSVPFSVILIVPLGIIGTILATWMTGLGNDVYFQIGLLTTVGLSAKNAILIVEFAKALQDKGLSLFDATLQAVQLRLRPILMTSLAFMFGVLPLALSTGAGSASRRAIGTGVLGGMASATLLGLFFVPLFFVLVRGFFMKRKPVSNRDSVESATMQGEA